MMSAISDSGNPRYLAVTEMPSGCQAGRVGTAYGRGLDLLPTPAAGARRSPWLSTLKRFVNL